MKTFSQYLTEMSVVRAERIISGIAHDVNTIGIMTPTNPQAKQFPGNMNQLFVSQFKDMLHSMGYDPIPVGGKFDGNQEQSFLIKNISKEKLIQLGKMYDQESVIWGRKVIDNGTPHFHYEYIDGGRTTMTSDQLDLSRNVQKRQDNYSTIKGHKFVIPFQGE